jgi:hypothetical protein
MKSVFQFQALLRVAGRTAMHLSPNLRLSHLMGEE